MGVCWLLGDAENRPSMRIHVMLERLLPGELWMPPQMFRSFEIHAAGVTSGGGKTHFCCHPRIGSLVLNCPRHAKRWLPASRTAGREVDVPVQCTFVGILFILERIVVVSQKPLGCCHINLALVLGH